MSQPKPKELNMPGLVKFKKDAIAKEHRATVFELAEAHLKFHFRSVRPEEGEYIKILNVGNLVEGKANFHETGESYALVGVVMEYEWKCRFHDEPRKEKGVFGIWTGKCSPYAPNIFDNELADNEFVTDSSDRLTISKTYGK